MDQICERTERTNVRFSLHVGEYKYIFFILPSVRFFHTVRESSGGPTLSVARAGRALQTDHLYTTNNYIDPTEGFHRQSAQVTSVFLVCFSVVAYTFNFRLELKHQRGDVLSWTCKKKEPEHWQWEQVVVERRQWLSVSFTLSKHDKKAVWDSFCISHTADGGDRQSRNCGCVASTSIQRCCPRRNWYLWLISLCVRVAVNFWEMYVSYGFWF